MNTEEIFRDVKGYEGLYQVKSLNYGGFNKCKLLKPSCGKRGYYIVVLFLMNTKKTRSIHQLVAESFLNHKPDRTNKLVVNHIDLNKLNNHIDNIEITTNRENCNRIHIKSSSKYVGVSWNKRDSNWMARILIDGKRKYLGCFKYEISAHGAYQNALNKIS
jgi:hypothetical protein